MIMEAGALEAIAYAEAKASCKGTIVQLKAGARNPDEAVVVHDFVDSLLIDGIMVKMDNDKFKMQAELRSGAPFMRKGGQPNQNGVYQIDVRPVNGYVSQIEFSDLRPGVWNLKPNEHVTFVLGPNGVFNDIYWVKLYFNPIPGE